MKPTALLIFVLLPAIALSATHRETKNLEVSAAGILTMTVDAGAGSLSITGVEGLDKIEVKAEIEAEGVDRDEVRLLGEKLIRLELKREYNRAFLYSHSKIPPYSGITARIHLTIKLPANMNITTIDGSGSIDINNIVGNVTIDDNSGIIRAHDITGRIMIEDGSGDIEIEDVRGSLEIKDGSGQIVVQHVSGDLTITDASGGIEVNDIGGSVTVSDGSGSIDIYRVGKNVFIREPGSGNLEIDGVQGKVIVRE
jgi:hypothetical protein